MFQTPACLVSWAFYLAMRYFSCSPLDCVQVEAAILPLFVGGLFASTYL